MKVIITTLIALTFSSVNYADSCASWGCISTIEHLVTNAEGNIYIDTPLDESVANCTRYADTYFVLNSNSKNSDKIYSTLLAAYISKSKVQLRIIEGSPNCEIGYVSQSTKF